MAKLITRARFAAINAEVGMPKAMSNWLFDGRPSEIPDTPAQVENIKETSIWFLVQVRDNPEEYPTAAAFLAQRLQLT